MTPYVVANTFWNSFIASMSLITVSEFGDRTFFITSIMSVRHSRAVVFIASLAAMMMMTVASIILGILTTSISPRIIHYISISLFAIFGVKMLREGVKMTEADGMEEFDEAQKAICEREDIDKKASSVFGKNYMVFIQVFSLIAFAEWGDRSQLSTILLAAREGPLPVGLGAICGYFICFAVAVLGSRAVIQFISVKKITIFGGLVFIACALLKLYS